MAVYFIQIGDFIKIGHAKNVKQRLSDIQTSCPYDATLLGEIGVKHPKRFEGSLHKRFATAHHRGEWYSITDDLLSYITENADCRNVVDRGASIPVPVLSWVSDMRSIIDDMRSAIPEHVTPYQLWLF